MQNFNLNTVGLFIKIYTMKKLLIIIALFMFPVAFSFAKTNQVHERQEQQVQHEKKDKKEKKEHHKHHKHKHHHHKKMKDDSKRDKKG